MFCDKCGTKIEDNNDVCPNCGQKIIISKYNSNSFEIKSYGKQLYEGKSLFNSEWNSKKDIKLTKYEDETKEKTEVLENSNLYKEKKIESKKIINDKYNIEQKKIHINSIPTHINKIETKVDDNVENNLKEQAIIEKNTYKKFDDINKYEKKVNDINKELDYASQKNSSIEHKKVYTRTNPTVNNSLRNNTTNRHHNSNPIEYNTYNHNYVNRPNNGVFFEVNGNYDTNTMNNKNDIEEKNFNPVKSFIVFIFLLIFAWPIAFVYLFIVVNRLNKK